MKDECEAELAEAIPALEAGSPGLLSLGPETFCVVGVALRTLKV